MRGDQAVEFGGAGGGCRVGCGRPGTVRAGAVPGHWTVNAAIWSRAFSAMQPSPFTPALGEDQTRRAGGGAQ
ncbi:hypothetical protein CIK06_15295 [Plantactinospora sp. KBS50]|nr:hypothetical protein CIK06_15295 [Plantactinospora sp. KBS50]